MFPLAYWVDNLSPFLIRFSDNFGIRYYGIAYLLGFVVSWELLRRYARAGRSQVPREQIGDLMFTLVLGVMVGGRLGYFLLYQLGAARADPLILFRIWEGGMASHGGFIGVTLALWWYSRRHRVPLLHLADLVTTTVPAGLFFGRIANFINGELWGRITTVHWAVIFPLSEPAGTPTALIPPRHPSQLYEAALEGAFLFAYLQWRFWRTGVSRSHPGRLTGEFLLLYAVARVFCEQFREPDAALILGLSRGSFYSLFVAVAGVLLWWLAPRRAPDAPPAQG